MLGLLKIFVLPSGLILSSFVLGCIFLWVRKLRRTGLFMLALAAALYISFGNGPVAFWLLSRLENQHSPAYSSNKFPELDMIVTLAGFTDTEQGRPFSSQFNTAAVYRILETVKLARVVPKARVYITGYGQVPGEMRKMMVSLGVSVDRLVIEKQSSNTHESALQARNYCGNKPFFLVTSAGHMPRAMGAFNKAGLKPVPAPTDYRSIQNYQPIAILPSPLHLELSDSAIYEFLGILWYRLKGWI
jgi:uncharacterized SAM-binding protein YcdF (DUF218 family)